MVLQCVCSVQTIPTVRFTDSIIMAIFLFSLIGFFQVLGLTAAGYLAGYREGRGEFVNSIIKVNFYTVYIYYSVLNYLQ